MASASAVAPLAQKMPQSPLVTLMPPPLALMPLASLGSFGDNDMGLFEEAQCPAISPPLEIAKDRIIVEDLEDLYGNDGDDATDAEANNEACDDAGDVASDGANDKASDRTVMGLAMRLVMEAMIGPAMIPREGRRTKTYPKP
ncbi:hypothetical protein ABZP36_011349 [Zizania latifolia]